MSSWLVTGGAGFIGANFVRLALGVAEARIVVLDALTYAGDLATIADLSEHVEFVHGNICDAELVGDVMRRHEVTRVFNFAAESHVDRSILGPATCVRTNVEGTFTLLEAARVTWQGRSDCLFIHVSTDEVYGELGSGETPCNELSPYRPSSPYSATKAAADHLVRAWQRTYGLPTIITNCSNNYGPWQYPEKLIPLMILNALERKPLPVYGDGQQIRDWIHVEDHCRGILAAAERGRPGETYVISACDERMNLEIVQAVCEIVDEVDSRAAGETRTLIRHVVDRPGHDRRYALDSAKLRTETGWTPLHLLRSSLPDLVTWYRTHQDWLEIVRSKGFDDYYKRQYAQR